MTNASQLVGGGRLVNWTAFLHGEPAGGKHVVNRLRLTRDGGIAVDSTGPVAFPTPPRW